MEANVSQGAVGLQSPYLLKPQTRRVAEVSPLLYWSLAVLILMTSAALRLVDLGGTDMWSDEIHTAIRVRGTFDQAFDSFYSVGNQAPLYYLFMRAVPNHTQLLLRLPAMLFGMAGLALMMAFLYWLYGDRRMALWVGALLALNPMHIVLSRTARFYTMLFALALIATFCFVLILRGSQKQRVWAALGLATGLALLTHYSALAIPATQLILLGGLWLAGRIRGRLIVRWGVVQFACALPYAAWMVVVLFNFTGNGYEPVPYPPALIDLPISVGNMLIGFDGVWTWAAAPGLLVAFTGLLAGAIAAARAWRKQPEYAYWLLLGLLPVAVMFAVSVTTGAQYRDRYFMVGMPAALALFALGWGRFSPAMIRLALAITLLTSGYLTLRLFREGAYERTDWQTATGIVARYAQPGEKVIFERELIFETFSVYADAVPPHFSLLEMGDSAAFEQDTQRLWVIYRIRFEDFHRQAWVDDVDPLTPGLSPISDWLRAREDRILQRYPFKGGMVFLLTGT